MLLRHQLEHAGDRLFRHRSTLPLLAILEVPIAIAHAHPGRPGNEALAWLGLLLALAGLGFRAFVVGHVPRGTSGRIHRRQKARSLNTTGAYSVVRNPLYVGNFFCWTGVSLAFRDPLLIVFSAAGFLVFYLLVILREERFLEERFGGAYRDFAARVPCLVPEPRLWRAPELTFSLRTVLRREHDTVFATLTALTALQALWHAFVPGAGPLGVFWVALWSGALALWLVVKALKRFTRLLRVPRVAPPAVESPAEAPPAP